MAKRFTETTGTTLNSMAHHARLREADLKVRLAALSSVTNRQKETHLSEADALPPLPQQCVLAGPVRRAIAGRRWFAHAAPVTTWIRKANPLASGMCNNAGRWAEHLSRTMRSFLPRVTNMNTAVRRVISNLLQSQYAAKDDIVTKL
jgi:hypothetical protein